MTDEQIIKALECCNTDVRESTCPKCAFYKKHRCSTLMLNAISDLIDRQKAEIERNKGVIKLLEKDVEDEKAEIENLKVELKAMRGAANSYKLELERKEDELHRAKVEISKHFDYMDSAANEAIKEFAKLIIDKSRNGVIRTADIPDLVKEMTEE